MDVGRRNFLRTYAKIALGALSAGFFARQFQLLENSLPVEKYRSPIILPRMRPDETYTWAFGHSLRGDPFVEKSRLFNFWFNEPVGLNKRYSFREAFVKSCEELDFERSGKPIALCMSGGTNCEALAITFHRLGIPFEMFFLDNWGVNRNSYLNWISPLAASLKKQVNIVSIKKAQFVNEIGINGFKYTGTVDPGVALLVHLFESIPRNYYIVTGDGDFDRDLRRYSNFQNEYPTGSLIVNSRNTLPMKASSIAFDIWAAKTNRPGGYYFFRSTHELIQATLNSEKFEIDYPRASYKNLLFEAFPEIVKRPDNSNWDGRIGEHERRMMKQIVTHDIRLHAEYDWWAADISTRVQLQHLFSKEFEIGRRLKNQSKFNS